MVSIWNTAVEESLPNTEDAACHVGCEAAEIGVESRHRVAQPLC
jgi:hypothetical protein